MNIYQNVEVYVREFDSKLLTSILAAKDDNESILLPIGELKFLLKWIKLPIGIFHNKSLTPSKLQVKFHKDISKLGFLITSLDEEHGLHWYDYAKFGKLRFSPEMIELSSYVFCWGNHDKEWLSSQYPDFSNKFILSGSPRADFWKSKISTESYQDFNDRYILFSTNLYVNSLERSWEGIKRLKSLEFDKRDPDIIHRYLNFKGEQYLVFVEFLKAIEYLSNRFKDLNIVVRPHPREYIQPWKDYLSNCKNVKVIREGSISDWIFNANALVHNGCTSALEATISNTPVITYLPRSNLSTAPQFFNDLGYIAKNKNELGEAVQLATTNQSTFYHKYDKEVMKSLHKRLYLPVNGYCSELITNYWNNLKYKFNKTKRLRSFKLLIFILLILFRLKNYLFGIFNSDYPFKTSLQKYPGVSKQLFKNKFERICKSIGVNSEEFIAFYISPRVQLIYKKNIKAKSIPSKLVH